MQDQLTEDLRQFWSEVLEMTPEVIDAEERSIREWQREFFNSQDY